MKVNISSELNKISEAIDDIQAIITEYMKFNAYSVGISDLIANNETNQSISNVINEKKNSVNNLIDETHLGIFTNKTQQKIHSTFCHHVGNGTRCK